MYKTRENSKNFETKLNILLLLLKDFTSIDCRINQSPIGNPNQFFFRFSYHEEKYLKSCFKPLVYISGLVIKNIFKLYFYIFVYKICNFLIFSNSGLILSWRWCRATRSRRSSSTYHHINHIITPNPKILGKKKPGYN